MAPGAFSDPLMATGADGPVFPLSLAQEGERVHIVALRAGRSLDRRLADLGLHVGTELSVRQRQPGGGVVVSREGTRVALGGGMAHKILVAKLEAE